MTQDMGRVVCGGWGWGGDCGGQRLLLLIEPSDVVPLSRHWKHTLRQFAISVEGVQSAPDCCLEEGAG